MMFVVNKIKTFSVLFLFSICIFIWFIGSNSAKAQNYFSFPPNPLSGNLFGIQGMPTSTPLFTSNYQWGQAWNPFGSNLNPNFGVIPAGYYSGSTQTKQMAEGQLIVHLSDQVQIEQYTNGPRTNMAELNALIEKYGVYEIDASGSGEFYVLKFSKSHDVNDVRKAFEGLTDHVKSAEPNLIRKAHSTSSGSNTMMGGMMGGLMGGLIPQVSSFSGQYLPGQGFSYPGTGLTFGSQLPATQPLYSSFPFSQYTYGPSLAYSPAWQTQGLSFMQPSFNTWQQTSWGIPQSYYINPFSGDRF